MPLDPTTSLCLRRLLRKLVSICPRPVPGNPGLALRFQVAMYVQFIIIRWGIEFTTAKVFWFYFSYVAYESSQG